MLYGVLYGAERMVVEGMRTDSLYIGNTTLRVSQLLSMIIVAVALAFFIYFMIRAKKGTLPHKMLPIIDEPLTAEDDEELSDIVVNIKNENSEEKENADN